MAQDVFKMLKDLELKAVGLDDKTNKMQEGYFVAFRSIGLPIHAEDYENPYTPTGGNLAKDIPVPPPMNPSDPNAPKTGSASIDTTKAFQSNVARDQQSFLSTFALVDSKLQLNNQYSVMPGSSKLSDSWYAIITGASGIPSKSVPNDELQKALDDARAKLQDKDGNATPHYQAYMNYEDTYKDKVNARNRAYAAAFSDPMKLQQWPEDGVTYQDDIEEAMNRWTSLGFKMEIENAINTLAAQGTDPAIALITRAKQRFLNSQINFQGYGNIPYIALSPRTWYDADNDDGWNEYTNTDFHSESQFTASQTSFGGGAGFNVGLWSGSASFDHADEDANSQKKTSNVKIKFSYAIVDIDRPWLDTSLLNLSNWFLVGDYQKDCISTGLFQQQVPAQGSGLEPTFLPSVITSLILVKDVHLSWDNWQEDWKTHKDSNSGSASVGVWCFTAESHFSHAKQSRAFNSDDSGEELVIPGIQLIGYVSQIMPASPQQNSSDFEKKTGS